MKVHTIKTYSYDELSEEAKEKAYQEWYETENYYAYENECNDTINCFESFMQYVNVKDWEFGGNRNYVNFDISEDLGNLKGVRLYKWIINNLDLEKIKEDCCFTGGLFDDVILQPLKDFLKRPCKHTSFDDLMQECFNAWLQAAQNDYEYQLSEEVFIEICECNGYEFLINGKSY